MRDEARKQLYQEANNWLNRGRSRFIGRLVEQYLESQAGVHDLLEVGAGAGQNLAQLARHGHVDALEVGAWALSSLRQREELRTLYCDPLPEAKIDRTYDVIVAADVLEHIENDGDACIWMAQHLKPGGLLILTVPAFMWLFSAHDIAVEHYRRYTAGQLLATLPDSLDIRSRGYFNMTLFPLAVMSRAVWSLKRAAAAEVRSDEKQSSQLPSGVASTFAAILGAESAAIARFGGLPWGLTAFCVAQAMPAR